MTNKSSKKKTFIKKLLEIEPLGAKAKNTDGYCLLLHYIIISDVDFVRHLLHLGADPSAQTYDRGSALMCAVKHLAYNSPTTTKCEEVKEFIVCLIIAGANVLAADKLGCTVLCHLIKIGVKYTAAKNLLEYIIMQEPFQSETLSLNCREDLTPQAILLQSFYSWKCSDVCDMILNSRCKDVNAIFMSKLHPFARSQLPMNALCYVMSIAQTLDSRLNFLDAEFVEKLISHGFEVSSPHGVSPLTVLMFQSYNFFQSTNMRTSYTMLNNTLTTRSCWFTVKKLENISDLLQLQLQLAEKLIERGANVQQQILSCNNDNLQQWRRDLYIPDALWIAFLLSK
jgi:hypothetical protein